MRPVNFHSRSFHPAEQNYPTHDAELLAIIDSIFHWRDLLEGTEHHICIKTDNNVLRYFQQSQHLSR
jgi:hypothetical protein